MSKEDATAWLGGWEGYRVAKVERVSGHKPAIWITLAGQPGRAMICEGCGQTVEGVHESTVRAVRDLPILDAETWLLVPRCRLACPRCGPRLERLAWLGRYARVTARLAESVAKLCHVLPVKQVAGFFGLAWSTVKAIDKKYLAQTLGPVDLAGIREIAMDEFAIQKGHRYATVVVEPHTKRVLWVGRGRSRDSVRPFFELLGKEGCAALTAVAMDMHAAFEQEVRHHCPQAAIVYDLFHVVAKYGREVIDRVRVDEANRLHHDKKARKVVKTARWLLLRNRDNIPRDEDKVRLDELLAANAALMTTYVLKDDLKELWRFTDPKAAMEAWQAWKERALASAVKPLILFAKRLEPYLEGILAHCQWPLHTSLLEGINNKIKVIKRMAYGFRDDDYFFLKVRAAFPGIRR
ncbi:transposase [Magnetospirillum sp. ME-1]|uniref:ISL3 family transposase n=1 Tax=Magnetospirillum sp. ME-1 TaxID=1639348 RepID=UPI000A179A2E|nr:ISL3 family transposase [Magnetospirillum sp. ME-1]ARJ66103.1 transposase [Magnetospirillum sp. ME-1]